MNTAYLARGWLQRGSRNAQLCALWLHGVGTEDMGDGMC